MNTEKRDRGLFVGAALWLVYIFIRSLMPTDELPSSGLNALSIALELGLFIGLVAMAPRILRSLPEGASRGGWIFLLVAGVIAGLGILGVRLSGGPRVELPPRRSSTSTAAEGLPKQFHELLGSLEKMNAKSASGRWMQAVATRDPAKMRTLTRQDLQEQRELCRQMNERLEQIQNVFAQAKSQGIAFSTLSKIPGETRPEAFAAAHDGFSATYEYLGVIDQHWDEWLTNPIPAADAELKPWQREVQRLADKAAVAGRQFHALLQDAVPASLAGTETATLPKKLQEQIDRLMDLTAKVAASRWMTLKENPATASSRTREDLHVIRDMYSQLHECAEGALKVITQAQSNGIDLTAFHEEKALGRPEFYRAALQAYDATGAYFVQIDQHWDEWKAQPVAPDEKTMKPWQQEMKRLDAARLAASKEMQAAIHPSAAPSPAPPEVTGLTKELRDLGGAWNTSLDKLEATRWYKIDFNDPAQKRTLTRRDFEEAGELQRERSEYQERIVKVLAQAKSQRIDVSGAAEAGFLLPEFWRGAQEFETLRLKQRKLIDQHWDEWLTSPETVNAKSKPWQREIKRLSDEMEAHQKQIAALVETPPVAATPAPVPSPPGSRAPSPPGANFDELALQTRMLPAVADYTAALKRLQATRWVKSPDANAYHPQKISRADLHDAGEKLREVIAAIDKLRAGLDAQTVPVPAAEKEFWRIKRETSLTFQQLTGILEENWKEWHESGIQPKTGEAKPWQKEALRLQGEIDKLKQNQQTSILL